jgi:hypothetical protein
MPDVKIKRVTFSESGIFSSKREYLRITRKEFMFDICAAPFGSMFFVSYWQGEETLSVKSILTKIPFIGTFLARLFNSKTYYQLDTENMFSSCIRACVMEAIDNITSTNGIRGLSLAEMKPQETTK